MLLIEEVKELSTNFESHLVLILVKDLVLKFRKLSIHLTYFAGIDKII